MGGGQKQQRYPWFGRLRSGQGRNGQIKYLNKHHPQEGKKKGARHCWKKFVEDTDEARVLYGATSINKSLRREEVNKPSFPQTKVSKASVSRFWSSRRLNSYDRPTPTT